MNDVHVFCVISGYITCSCFLLRTLKHLLVEKQRYTVVIALTWPAVLTRRNRPGKHRRIVTLEACAYLTPVTHHASHYSNLFSSVFRGRPPRASAYSNGELHLTGVPLSSSDYFHPQLASPNTRYHDLFSRHSSTTFWLVSMWFGCCTRGPAALKGSGQMNVHACRNDFAASVPASFELHDNARLGQRYITVLNVFNTPPVLPYLFLIALKSGW